MNEMVLLVLKDLTCIVSTILEIPQELLKCVTVEQKYSKIKITNYIYSAKVIVQDN